MKFNYFLSIAIYICIIHYCNGKIRNITNNLRFGVATSAIQSEGGWNAADKAESIWDRYIHKINVSNADVSSDSYHHVHRDIEMLKELGVNFYKFSISWPRLLPTGFNNKISTYGAAYYNRLINGLIDAGIEPVVTLYHWDLPQSIQDLGGWLNSSIVEHMTNYANVVFWLYGDRVKTWFTINEPIDVCYGGNGGITKPPDQFKTGKDDFICGHNLLKAHATVYHLYDKIYRPMQQGRIGIVLNTMWMEPATQNKLDIEAANRLMTFYTGWFAHPILSEKGDYPQTVKDIIAKNSKIIGLKQSLLPEFEQCDIDWIKGTTDFLGINHYTTLMVKNQPSTIKPFSINSTTFSDLNVTVYVNSTWPTSASSWLRVVPWGFGKVLRWIRDNLGNPEVFISENGYSDTGEINDDNRTSYLKTYINSMLDAIEDGCNVTAYTVWSLMDDFEWMDGYKIRFGLYHVDFEDPQRTRVPKKSALFYRNVINTRTIDKV